MKYDIAASLADQNTSHAQVVDLVGSGQRVLDVGCSTGYLGRLLKTKGNSVSGVEIDPEAAKVAEVDLDRVVVGDLESLDLVGEFGEGSFDVLVFADVLEHLRDPLGVLAGGLDLLAPGGSVVVSLPNIAHGAVRLALLEGRFEYRPLGLLDDTHLRFFTHRTVSELVDTAGLLVTEMRRTTADAFATEIPLVADHFEPGLLDRVRSDPESQTYQFVFRAIRVRDAQEGPARRLAEELLARDEELSALRTQVGEILALGGKYLPPHTVGLLDAGCTGPAAAWAGLRASVTATELRRRLSGIAVVHLSTSVQASPATWRGEPVVAVEVDAADYLADTYDAIVVVGGPGFTTGTELVAELDERGCPVVVFGGVPDEVASVAGQIRSGSVIAERSTSTERLNVVPDALLLVDRVAGGIDLGLRRRYLRQVDVLGVDEPYVLVAAAPADAQGVSGLAEALRQLPSESGCAVVVVPAPGRSADVGGAAADSGSLVAGIADAVVVAEPTELDLLALIAGAKVVVTDSGPPAAVALALGRPFLTYGNDPGLDVLASWIGDLLVVPTADEVLGRLAALDAGPVAADGLVAARTALEFAYDDLASTLTGAAARTLSLTLPEALQNLQTRTASFEQANTAMAARLAAERNAVGTRITEMFSTGDQSGQMPPAEEARRWRQEAQHWKNEYEALMASKSMRLLAPGRRLYGRLRRLSR